MDPVSLAVIILAGGLILYAMMHSKTSVNDLVALAQGAGFSGADAYVAAAVALAESGGDPNILGDLDLAPDNGPAVGLWQINSAKHTEYTVEELKDPATNAAEAFAIYSGRGNTFRDWTTFNTGKYLEFMGQVQA